MCHINFSTLFIQHILELIPRHAGSCLNPAHTAFCCQLAKTSQLQATINSNSPAAPEAVFSRAEHDQSVEQFHHAVAPGSDKQVTDTTVLYNSDVFDGHWPVSAAFVLHYLLYG